MHIVRNPTPSVHSLAFAAVLLMTVVACMDSHSPTGVTSPIARSSDVIGSDVEFGARNYNLTSFDISTLALTATSNLVPPNPVIPNNPYVPGDPYRTFSTTFTTETRFAAARLDRYQPGDPYCPGLAANYNASIAIATSDGGLFYGLIGQMAANHCNARVLVDLNSPTIRSFEPVP